MKAKIYFRIIILLLIATCNKTFAQNANTTLSNLTAPTKVNVNLLPSKDSSINLGSNNKNWKDIYIKGRIYLADTPAIYSISNSDFFAGPNAGIKLKYFNGQRNTGIGANALYYGGYSNTAVGWKSLSTDSTGYYNAAVGTLSLLNNESGNENTAVGNAAMYRNITGYSNTAVGSSALQGNAGGSNNAAVGAYSLYSNLGSKNAAFGYNSLYACTFGYDNTSAGYQAGQTVTTGTRNTFLGSGADVSNGTFTNSTAIGYLAMVGASNHIHIGNTSITSIGGQVSWTSFSDERIKSNIKENVPGLQFINLLKPVTYHFNVKKEEDLLQKKTTGWQSKYEIEKMQFTGFLAQEVEAAAKKIGYDFSGVDVPENNNDAYGLRYADFVVPLVKAVQELSNEDDSIKNENTAQQNQINNLQKEIDALKAMIVSNQSSAINQQTTIISSASLSQNIPNPFSNSTTINYSLPQQFSSAKIIVYDESGKTIKSTNLLAAGKGSIILSAPFRAGASYQYSLFIDGRLIDTKQMECIKQ